jgi:outer membrane protein OmpA-like peptidoglycan-associated protein
MQRSRALFAILLIVAVGLGGGFAYRTFQELDAEIGQLRGSVADLHGELASAEERANDARDRADEAERQARSAEELSELLAERAESARGEADKARGEAAEQSAARWEAEAERQAAQEKSRGAVLQAARAEQEAREARERLVEIREQRERDLDRLERSLSQIAETRRTALDMVMNLGDSIEFDFNRAELRPGNRETLSRIAGVLLTAEGFGIQVYGHTDDVGSTGYNQELSERRAAAVRRYLIDAGVSEHAIQSKGFGKAAPLVEGTDPDSRQKNRRVEIAIVEVSGEMPVDFIAEGPGETDADRR